MIIYVCIYITTINHQQIPIFNATLRFQAELHTMGSKAGCLTTLVPGTSGEKTMEMDGKWRKLLEKEWNMDQKPVFC